MSIANVSNTEPVPFFDRRPGRREQRRRYDERRRELLPKHNICLIELNYDLFQHNRTKPLKREGCEMKQSYGKSSMLFFPGVSDPL